MTYEEIYQLGSISVRLADGSVGLIVAWHPEDDSVGVRMSNGVVRHIPVASLIEADGSIVER